MADYWIKLYHEIIDDPKMATLPDRLWRRGIELFLLAGKLCQDKSGKLPDTRQLAWILRMSTDDLQIDLEQLAATGIITPIPNGWLVTNFEKRQSAATSTERSQYHRKRKQQQQYYDDATGQQRNVAQINRLTEQSRTESEPQSPPSSPGYQNDGVEFQAFQKATGMMSYPGRNRELILDALNGLRVIYPTSEALAGYMAPFYQEWVKRGYSRSNCAWLYDWAVSGEIPAQSAAREKVRTAEEEGWTRV